jgi:hypothetical protein
MDMNVTWFFGNVEEPFRPFCPKTGEKFRIFSMNNATGWRIIEEGRTKIMPDGQESLFINECFVATLPCVTSDKERREQVVAVIDRHYK